MYNLTTFGFSEMMDCRSRIRAMIDADTGSLGEGAEMVVRFFRNEFVDADGAPVFPLVRLFKTHPYVQLDSELQSCARKLEPHADDIPGLRCLVLLATDGEKLEWRSRRRSRNHQAIPLTSEEAIANAPMISQLIEQFDVPVATVLRPDPALLLDFGEKAYNVFYVPHAQGSPYIVDQESFVVPFGIRSVIGFGGMLATGDLFALVLFSRLPIPPETADLFKVIGLNLKIAMMRIARKPLFVEAEVEPDGPIISPISPSAPS